MAPGYVYAEHRLIGIIAQKVVVYALRDLGATALLKAFSLGGSMRPILPMLGFAERPATSGSTSLGVQGFFVTVHDMNKQSMSKNRHN